MPLVLSLGFYVPPAPLPQWPEPYRLLKTGLTSVTHLLYFVQSQVPEFMAIHVRMYLDIYFANIFSWSMGYTFYYFSSNLKRAEMFILNKMQNINFFPVSWSVELFLNHPSQILNYQYFLLCYSVERCLVLHFILRAVIMKFLRYSLVYITSYSKFLLISSFILISVFYV